MPKSDEESCRAPTGWFVTKKHHSSYHIGYDNISIIIALVNDSTLVIITYGLK